ncbi:hypothetical protein [Microbacterium sp.]|uniref:hypothetical protein n=1 Tax=Microbacterium sp. TaxID=51671 RepID=UPI003340E77B
MAISLIGLIGLLMQMSVVGSLPPATPDATGTRRTTLFAPVVGLVLVCSVFVLALLALAIRAIVRPPRRWMWIAGSVLAVTALAMPFLVAGVGRPTF